MVQVFKNGVKKQKKASSFTCFIVDQKNVIDVTCKSIGNVSEESKAKLNVMTGEVFNFEKPFVNKLDSQEFLVINGDEADYPIERDDLGGYKITNQILLGRVGRVSVVSDSGIMMSNEVFDLRFNKSLIPPEAQIRIVATNETMTAEKYFQQLTKTNELADDHLNKMIQHTAMVDAIGNYLTNFNFDPTSVIDALGNNDEVAINAMDITICEEHENDDLQDIIERIDCDISCNIDSLTNISNLAKTLFKNRDNIMTQQEWADWALKDHSNDRQYWEEDQQQQTDSSDKDKTSKPKLK